MFFTLISAVIAMGKNLNNIYLTLKIKQVFLTENGVKILVEKSLFYFPFPRFRTFYPPSPLPFLRLPRRLRQ